MPIRLHDEAPDDLREAIRFTAEETGFVPRMIEKDYFCSVVLEALGEGDSTLVFKGGTCLAKVHSGFFRLSEDLDFTIPTERKATRGERRRAVARVKKLVEGLPAKVGGLELRAPLTGRNSSTQYNATVAYHSLLAPTMETIQIEVGLREPLLAEPERGLAQTMPLHWMSRDPYLATFTTRCLSYPEAMAEKLRAALTRRDPAIRDFFNIDQQVALGGCQGGPATLRRSDGRVAPPQGDPGRARAHLEGQRLRRHLYNMKSSQRDRAEPSRRHLRLAPEIR